ncbi:unnamed protein product [Cercopithifilaria johnstoni]|uniref:Uncharacterized protein n=1 Tax=Cercopithifilaria johnstoni TaxID=2874296 RepID=A0A8J2LQ51_9BILA|nr:unnamed protein product [Cercopithifilaria johnstoni]
MTLRRTCASLAMRVSETYSCVVYVRGCAMVAYFNDSRFVEKEMRVRSWLKDANGEIEDEKWDLTTKGKSSRRSVRLFTSANSRLKQYVKADTDRSKLTSSSNYAKINLCWALTVNEPLFVGYC